MQPPYHDICMHVSVLLYSFLVWLTVVFRYSWIICFHLRSFYVAVPGPLLAVYVLRFNLCVVYFITVFLFTKPTGRFLLVTINKYALLTPFVC